MRPQIWAILSVCCCAVASAYVPGGLILPNTVAKHSRIRMRGGIRQTSSEASLSMTLDDLPHLPRENEGMVRSMSRRAALRSSLAAGLAWSGLGSAQQASADVPPVSWPVAAGGRVSDAEESKREVRTSVQSGQPTSGARADLSSGERRVREKVAAMVNGKPEVAAGLLRLAFHDATARDTETGEGGANGSIRLELDRRENYGLGNAVRALEGVKEAGGLSWADTIAVAGAAAVEASGGPRIPVALGRRDASAPDPRLLRTPVGKCEEATTPGGGRSCRGQAEATIPNAGLDSDGLRNYFGRLGFDDGEVVALMGGHTLGRWTSLLGMRKDCLKNLNRDWASCLPEGQRLPFVSEDPDRFSNSYFKWLLLWNRREIQPGDVHFIPTDVVLVVDAGFQAHVRQFAADQQLFFSTFARAYTRLVSLGFSPGQTEVTV